MSEHWLIAGANRGIGLELVRQLIARGDRVTASVRNDEARAALAAKLAPQHAEVETLVFDSRDFEAVSKAARSAGAGFDVVFANAGAFGPSPQTVLNMDFGAALDLFSINTLGPLRVAEAFLPRLKGAANPRIALMSSELGSMANKNPGAAIYSATKAALNKLAQCLAEELSPQGVTVVALHPGWVKTDMGGPNAPLGVTESAAGLLATIDGLSLNDSGGFLNYRGETVPW
ncbi:SDR family oxidoreductase [Methylocystis heyeri]|uniref:SDR family NAD(P)-dependent oxidoreductase n=1 Tax=Methylocystis heyeri TaxID=391905 RepID=A0A6B8KHL8_9HYPH|nr:SDR family oxidoreductase [Methylocystis heyeri]QGM46465.1 SDR family NAD(P)-dependent oxidoreductase [Methylocystis heyeri]